MPILRFIKYIIDNGISTSKENELICIIDAFVKELLDKNKCHLEDEYSLDLLMNETTKVIDDSSISKMRKIIVFCSNCQSLLLSNKIFCPNCKKQLIKSCSKCKLTTEISFYKCLCGFDGLDIREWYHIDCVSAEGCYFLLLSRRIYHPNNIQWSIYHPNDVQWSSAEYGFSHSLVYYLSGSSL